LYFLKLEEAKAIDYRPERLRQFGLCNWNQLYQRIIDTQNPYFINELADYMESYGELHHCLNEIDIRLLQDAPLKTCKSTPFI